MSYKEYLRFRRKVERVKKATRMVGNVVAGIGAALVILMMAAADSPDLGQVMQVYSAGVGMIALGAVIGTIRA